MVLGDGHPKFHALLTDLAAAASPASSGRIWDSADELAHQIEAGADIFLMPSLFEPCGLNQLYSLAHGTVPFVRATGGLADTVIDANPENLADGTATGFVFVEPTAAALWATIERALALWADREPGWAATHRNERRLVVGSQRARDMSGFTRKFSAGSGPADLPRIRANVA